MTSIEMHSEHMSGVCLAHQWGNQRVPRGFEEGARVRHTTGRCRMGQQSRASPGGGLYVQ